MSLHIPIISNKISINCVSGLIEQNKAEDSKFCKCLNQIYLKEDSKDPKLGKNFTATIINSIQQNNLPSTDNVQIKTSKPYT